MTILLLPVLALRKAVAFEIWESGELLTEITLVHERGCGRNGFGETLMFLIHFLM